MPNSNYRKGYKFEREIKLWLERNDYLVFRTAGSHSIADLIAFSPMYWRIVYLIQCKYGTARMNKAEIIKLSKIADRYNAVPVYCTKKPGKSVSFINLNTTTEIEFENREIRK